MRLLFVSNMIHAGTSLSVDAASCAARRIDEDSYELRPDMSQCGRGLLCLVDHCGGLLRLDSAIAACYAALIVDEDSCASLLADSANCASMSADAAA